MGREVTCDARWKGATSTGRALLETSEIRFRGGFQLSVPFAALTAVEVRNGVLTLTFGGDTAELMLGGEAEVWKERILHPPTLAEKLGVRAGDAVILLGARVGEIEEALSTRGAVVGRRLKKGTPWVILGVVALADLERLAAIRAALHPGGSAWVVWAKGQKTLTEDHVRAAARGAGLVDVKVARVSDTHSGLKLMIPRTQRGGTP